MTDLCFLLLAGQHWVLYHGHLYNEQACKEAASEVPVPYSKVSLPLACILQRFFLHLISSAARLFGLVIYGQHHGNLCVYLQVLVEVLHQPPDNHGHHLDYWSAGVP